MSEAEDGKKIVRMSSPGPDALSDPMFIIQKGDAFYVTLAVWEYDPEMAATKAQKDGYKVIKEYFEGAQLHHDGLKAVEVAAGNKTVHCATCKPHRPKPTPTKPHRPKPTPTKPHRGDR